MTWRKGPPLRFKKGASVVHLNPWTFQVVGGPVLVNGLEDPSRYSDEVIEFDRENYVWKAR